MGTFALFIAALGIEPKRRFSNKWVSLFLFFAFIRMFFDNSVGDNSAEWFNFWMSCANFIYVFCGVLLFYLVYCYAGRPDKYFKLIVCVCILNALLAAGQLFNYDFLWHNATGISGFMAIHSKLGQYSAMCLPILYYINPFLAIIPLFTLLASKSLSPIVASCLGLGLFLALTRARKIILAGLIAGLVLAITLNFGLLKSKFYYKPIIWKKTIQIALQKPYIGWGYGSFTNKVINETALDVMGSFDMARPQNDYTHTAQEMGFPILLCVMLFFINLFRKIVMLENKSKLITCLIISNFVILVNMSVQPVIRYASIAGTFIVLLAFLCKEVDDARSV
jgi:O-antigen ligase